MVCIDAVEEARSIHVDVASTYDERYAGAWMASKLEGGGHAGFLDADGGDYHGFLVSLGDKGVYGRYNDTCEQESIICAAVIVVSSMCGLH